MSIYKEKLNEICSTIERMQGTTGAKALRAVVMDLEGNGPIGEILHALDKEHFDMVINLLIEFRETGRREPFNAIHASARRRLNKNVEGVPLTSDCK
jgi:hypothetical protein